MADDAPVQVPTPEPMPPEPAQEAPAAVETPTPAPAEATAPETAPAAQSSGEPTQTAQPETPTAHIVGAQKLAFLVGSGIIAVRVSSSPTPTSPRFYFTEIKSASILLQVMFPNSEDFPT